LNPAKHIDPVGTIVFPLASMALGGILFGWAKPVPVNFENLRNPKRDMLWVAAAGPGSNVVQGLIWASVAKIIALTGSNWGVAEFWFDRHEPVTADPPPARRRTDANPLDRREYLLRLSGRTTSSRS